MDKLILDIQRYMKNYEDKLNRNGIVIENYRFSDEREWRFVPKFDEAAPFIPVGKYKTQEQKDLANANLLNLTLEFEPKDINYIIIENENEISEFIDVLRKSKATKYTMEDVERLISRMITTEQILTDF